MHYVTSMTTNQTDTAAKPYSVNLWGSHPDADNDDCWTGDDFATLAEARAAFADIDGTLLKHTPGDTVHPRVYWSGWAFAVIDGPDVHEVKPNPDQRAVRAHRREMARDAAESRREQAMQAGMAFGCDGYNDEMGW